MRTLLFLIILVALSCADHQEDLQDVQTNEGRTTEKYSINQKGLKEGLYKRFVDERIREECFFVDDTLHGMRSIYDSLGVKEIEEHYNMGTFAGPYRTFYKDGNVELEGQYVDGKMSGQWQKYYQHGALMEQVTMRDNNENGAFVEYHPNGALKAEGNYKDGDNEHGLLKLYDEEGQLERKMMCTDGICNTTWTKIKDGNHE